MSITIATTPGSQWQSLTPLLHALAWQQQEQNPENWYQQPPEHGAQGQCYLLLHSRPEVSIAHLLDADHTPEQALALWQHAAHSLLGFYKHNRRNAAMVCVADAAANPSGLIQWLSSNHPAFSQLLPVQPAPVQSLTAPVDPSPLNLLLATQLVAQTHSLKHLLAELEASSLPLVEPHCAAPQLDLNALYHALHTDARTRSQAQAQAQEENQLILNQLFSVQEELEKYYQQQKAQADTITQLEQALVQKEQHSQKITQSLQAAQEQVSASEKKYTQVQQQLQAQQQKNTEQENARVEQEKTLKDAQEENQLVLSQLFTVQEELEKYYLQNKTLQQQVQQQKTLITEKNQKLKNLSNSKKALQAQLEPYLPKTPTDITAPVTLAPPRKGLKNLKVVRLLGKVKPSNRAIARQAKLIAKSDLFNAEWYTQQYPDVATANISPAEHYIRHGGKEGRDPSAHFSSKGYLSLYPDVAQAGLNPLVHYLLHGKAEGRQYSAKP